MTGRANASLPSPSSIVGAHGILLFTALVLFRLAKIAFANVHPVGFDRVALFLPEIGFVLLFEAFWMVLSRGRSGRVWHGLLVAGHLLVYAHLLVNHGFFVNTGYRVDFEMARYAVTHLGTIWGLVEEGVDRAFWLQVVAVLVAMLLAPRLASLLDRVRVARPHVAVNAAIPLVGLALVFWSPASDPYLREFSDNDAVAFAASTVRATLPKEREVPGMVAPAELYQAPRLVSAAERRPNILLLILESTGAQATGVDFGANGAYPHLAAIARDSLVFDSVYSTVTHTSKTLVGILCGMVARAETRITDAMPGSLPLNCLPRLLEEVGYRTAFMQTARGSFENRPGLVGNLGFQHGAYQETLHREPFEKTGYLGMDEFAMLEPAVAWAVSDERPFFLTLLTVTPHHPYEVPGRPSDTPAAERYLWALEHQDAFVGALHDRLREAGALDDTLLIVVGDHGEAFGEHKIYEHDAVSYEEVVWTPLLLTGPQWLREPRRVGGLRSQLDLVPTILEILGVEWEGRLPGRSLLSTPGHDRVFVSCWDRNRCLAMRRGDRKVVLHFNRRVTEVFDLATDPAERKNLADTLDDAELAEIEAAMRAFKLSVDVFWAQHPMGGDAAAGPS